MMWLEALPVFFLGTAVGAAALLGVALRATRGDSKAPSPETAPYHRPPKTGSIWLLDDHHRMIARRRVDALPIKFTDLPHSRIGGYVFFADDGQILPGDIFGDAMPNEVGEYHITDMSFSAFERVR